MPARAGSPGGLRQDASPQPSSETPDQRARARARARSAGRAAGGPPATRAAIAASAPASAIAHSFAFIAWIWRQTAGPGSRAGTVVVTLLAIAASTSRLGGPARRPGGGGQPEQRGQDQEARPGSRPGTRDVGDARVAQRGATSPAPSAVPTTIPTTAPNSAMITDSERIIARTCRRFIPTARSRPISWVRSNTDSISVLTIPISAIRTASASST